MSAITVAVGRCRSVYGTFTRPNDTTTYAIGDVISDSTSASTVLTFSNAVPQSGGSSILQQVTMVVGEYQTTKLSADLFLFDTAPASYGVDNAAFTPTDAELLRAVAVVTLDGTATSPLQIHGGDLTAGATGNCIIEASDLGIPVTALNTDNAIYGVLVARNAYVPAAVCPFYIRLRIID